ncbi:hypothetical protein [Hydrogenimonas urashimensis]|uniref:hypothetical protein n=1 Tax=Hydrogenimonas urashimensis TaxID=2740515 RepID=UPI001915900B|nr:hypothetical protein [Hydrogenimonas urashimensis]
MQSSRIVYALLALLLLASMAVFAWINPSYQKAFEAKWYYFMGDYDEAYALAKEAYALDPYNRMALTVMTQTEVAERYLGYIREGAAFLRQIEEIANRQPISNADRIRVKMMCEVMIERYEKLIATPLTDEELIERARNIYEKFKNLYTSLFKQK